jgi:hypothetical protein
LCNRYAKCFWLKVVCESPATVDLHDGEPFPVLRFQMIDAADVDLVELELELSVERA